VRVKFPAGSGSAVGTSVGGASIATGASVATTGGGAAWGEQAARRIRKRERRRNFFMGELLIITCHCEPLFWTAWQSSV
jgi:hypothetical protein